MANESNGKRIVGMVHLGPLPGSPGAAGSPAAALGDIIERAWSDARCLLENGVSGFFVENFGDTPFFPDSVPPVTVAAMTRVTGELRHRADELASNRGLPRPFLGVNVLRNDALAALSIAATCDCQAIRVNVHCGAMVTDQGIVEGRAHETLRTRSSLGSHVEIFADVLVKHAAPLRGNAQGDAEVASIARETLERGRADALILTGRATGAPADLKRLRTVREALPDARLYVGSGVSVDTIADTLGLADGVIVGTALKRDGDVLAPVDSKRVAELVEAAGLSS